MNDKISRQEVWLRSFCAAFNAHYDKSNGNSSTSIAKECAWIADYSTGLFQDRFPRLPVRHEIVSPDIMDELIRDGWKVEAFAPNPFPQPYFYVMMSLEHERAMEYDTDNIFGYVHGHEGVVRDPWHSKPMEQLQQENEA